ncbi:MAG: hypothetical protein GF364_09855 [Candidatus Lokiarchaeota archaeon]|nr:hypothetical protein [Candidatus Lokiarchaeota archaeon]
MDKDTKSDETDKKSDYDEVSLIELKKKVDMMELITKTLKSHFDGLSNTISNLSKTVEYLTQTVETNKSILTSTLKKIKKQFSELNNQNEEETSISEYEVEETKIQMREEVDETNFLKALMEILSEIKKEMADKEHVKIKKVKELFKEKYSISDEKFEELLIDFHWKHRIELLPGTGDPVIKDHYGNIYHNISLSNEPLNE